MVQRLNHMNDVMSYYGCDYGLSYHGYGYDYVLDHYYSNHYYFQMMSEE